jgi:hypothetical protein
MVRISIRDEDIQTMIRMCHAAIDTEEDNSIRREQYKKLYQNIFYQIELSTDEDDEDF